MTRSIMVAEDGIMTDTGFLLICSGYLVEKGKVLLVHHKGFDKWVPPGGHIEPGETFAQTAIREFQEETGLQVEVISSQALIDPLDSDTVPEPIPFYVDVEYNSFAKPAIVQYFYVRCRSNGTIKAQRSEVKDVGWFSIDQLEALPTFNQVRSLARYSLCNYPLLAERPTPQN